MRSPSYSNSTDFQPQRTRVPALQAGKGKRVTVETRLDIEVDSMEQERKLIAISRQEFVELMEIVAKTVTNAVRERPSSNLPIYYKFPEDIVNMTGGHIAEATIRGWKSAGYLRTLKIGTKSYVKPDDWEWFLAHHKELMANNPRNREIRLSHKKSRI